MRGHGNCLYTIVPDVWEKECNMLNASSTNHKLVDDIGLRQHYHSRPKGELGKLRPSGLCSVFDVDFTKYGYTVNTNLMNEDTC